MTFTFYCYIWCYVGLFLYIVYHFQAHVENGQRSIAVKVSQIKTDMSALTEQVHQDIATAEAQVQDKLVSLMQVIQMFSFIDGRQMYMPNMIT